MLGIPTLLLAAAGYATAAVVANSNITLAERSAFSLSRRQANNGKCGLAWLELNLSPAGTIACQGSALQAESRERTWAKQWQIDAQVVVYPGNEQDVADTLKAMTKAPKWFEWTFKSGGHSTVGASAAGGLVIDLSRLNKVEVLKAFQLPDSKTGKTAPVISYQGGANWRQIELATANSGYVAIGARVHSVGAGGFSTGGGIGFLGGAYGFAGDNIVQAQVVLVDGTIVIANKQNQYSDLFWAINGGNGQFGIVTRFWVLAVPEPTSAQIGLYWTTPSESWKVRQNVVDFFTKNEDPHSLVYYVRGFIPPSLSESDPSKLGLQEVIITLRFADPTNPKQPNYDTVFKSALNGLTFTSQSVLTVPYEEASTITTSFFPEGFRRYFNGPQVPTRGVKAEYLNSISTRFEKYVADSLAKGDVPASALWVLQYVHPTLGGNLPKTEGETAWPHVTVGSQTLFSPAWSSAANDGLVQSALADLAAITYTRQQQLGVKIYDYVNYIAPRGTAGLSKNGGWDSSKYYGPNIARLQTLKQKYDPKCLLHKGPTFASTQCKAEGWASWW